MPAKNMDELVALCKRRGFVFQSGEIYGGLKGCYDYGPMGIEVKNNLRKAWWNSLIYDRDDIEGLESSLLNNRLVWKHSGHEDGFSDPLVECKACHSRMREDKMKDRSKCDNCGSTDLMEPRAFHLMMKVNIGPVESDDSYGYLRAETAQTTYVNFKNVMDSTSQKIPFGIAQMGKSFRNEITPRNFVFRMREFEQLEMQYFVNPKEDEKFYDEWKKIRLDWWVKQGINSENLKFEDHGPDDLAHYAKAAADIEYKFPHGFDELEGIHNRQDFDLGSHTKAQEDFDIKAKVLPNKDSNSKLNYVDPQTKENYIPFVVETAMGGDRGFVAILNEAYTVEDLGEGKTRTVLKFAKHIAPVKVAVIPLARNNEELVGKARELHSALKKLQLGRVVFENTGNIGKNYRKHDEIGTPMCITVDFDTIEKGLVTVRDRDTMEQTVVKFDEIVDFVKDFYNK
ncbi:MAG: glycine--tRNA ligase [Alphaproteobacteria bacterium]|jgi:glycyl-tRNA synthetase|nr:glycine--tRNA ligase [Alphaproteobacteria bacterium]